LGDFYTGAALAAFIEIPSFCAALAHFNKNLLTMTAGEALYFLPAFTSISRPNVVFQDKGQFANVPGVTLGRTTGRLKRPLLHLAYNFHYDIHGHCSER
jgi:hypothetical protein